MAGGRYTAPGHAAHRGEAGCGGLLGYELFPASDTAAVRVILGE